ncbi:alpha/beta hydrolase [Leptospira interrogans]|uniref:alpha/beta hydrolase n=1 Tax=Leptospira interrogans TaxID=173 RepID=UPI00177CA5D1|nr:alpha/beta hydrolase [Leptospira interrogans]MBE0304347.1 alpha/beta hydrolase [Leptospira interrogans serovar Yeoncheon]
MKIQLGIQNRFRKVGLTLCFLIFLFGANSINASYAKEILTYDLIGRNFYSLKTTYYTINVVHYKYVRDPGGPIIFKPRSVLFVHGFGDNSTLFEPLAKELILKGKAQNVYIMDLPGHGASTMAPGTSEYPANYSQLSVTNYADALRALLGRMTSTEGKKIQTIVGHSTGGLVIQTIQDLFHRNGGNLLSSFGIENTILLGSDIPSPLPWYGGDAPMSDPNSAKSFVWNFRILKILGSLPDPPYAEFGWFVKTPDDFYINTKYAVNGVPVTGAPTTEQLKTMSDLEPYVAAANIVGLDYTAQTTDAVPRISVAQNLWNGFNLKVVWMDKNVFFSQSETQGLAQYLKEGLNAITISDPEATHNSPFSKPSLFLSLF